MSHHLCKICNAFGANPNILNSINLDIFAGTKTYREICKYYTTFLPSGFAPITNQNIVSHKNHTDVSILLKPLVAQRQKIVVKGKDIYSKLYAAGKEDFPDYLHIMDLMMKCRFEDLVNIERVVQRASMDCDDAVEEFNLVKAAGSSLDLISKAKSKVRAHENRLFELMERRQNLWDSAQSDILNITGSSVEKERRMIQMAMVERLHETFNEMLRVLSSYIVLEAFSGDVRQGRIVFNKILEIMNNTVKPVLQPLDESKKVVVKQKRLKA